MQARRLEGEWLDELPGDDPRARRSRSDLARINAIMGSARIVAAALKPMLAAPPRTLVELGAGDGLFALRLARRLDVRAGLEVTLVDRQRIVSPETLDAFAAIGARVTVAQDDVFAWLERSPGRVDAIIANLFLHHFDDRALARMLPLVARRTSAFVACETSRSSASLAGARMLGAIGCNDVTRHDAVASVRAGFIDGDLTALWPTDGDWTLHEGPRFLSHVFTARRP